jgi:predicted transcriptional regulator
MMKKDPKILGLRLPADLRKWIADQAALLNKSETFIATELLIRGLRAKTTDEVIAGIQDAAAGGFQREILRQTLVTRYIVEAQLRGSVRHPETLGTDALTWADKQLLAMQSQGEQS